MDIKLIALDMDGTLLNSDKEISPRTLKALEIASQKDAEIVICTGRVMQGIRKYLPSLPFVRYCITSNGASVFDIKENKIICQNLIPTQKAQKVLQVYRSSGGLAEVYSRNMSYMSMEDYSDLSNRYGVGQTAGTYLREKNEPVDSLSQLIESRTEGIEKFNLSFFPAVTYSQIWNRLNVIGGLSLTYSDYRNIEVNVHDCNKGTGLAALTNHLNIPAAQVMAVGDSFNDREMLLFAGNPVAMGNASDDIKSLTSTVIHSNDEEGIAHFLEILFQQYA